MGRSVWIGLALSSFLTLHASELFAGEQGEFHSINRARRGDVTFFRNNEQLGKKEAGGGRSRGEVQATERR